MLLLNNGHIVLATQCQQLLIYDARSKKMVKKIALPSKAFVQE